MSEAQTNPQGEVDKPQLNMFDVMFGSEENTNPEQAIEKSKDTVQSENDLVSQLQEETDEVEAIAEEEEVSELEAVEEDQSEEEVEEVEEEVVKTETPVYTVKIDGDEHEVTLDELRNGYQRHADYTRKSQTLAEQRKAYESNLEAVQNERGQYADALKTLSAQKSAALERFNQLNKDVSVLEGILRAYLPIVEKDKDEKR